RHINMHTRPHDLRSRLAISHVPDVVDVHNALGCRELYLELIWRRVLPQLHSWSCLASHGQTQVRINTHVPDEHALTPLGICSVEPKHKLALFWHRNSVI